MAAIAVDHIVPKAQGGTDDVDNLQPICERCHTAKTQAESNGLEWDGKLGGCDAAGNPLDALAHWR